MLIRLNTQFTNPALPVAKSASEVLAADSSLLAWMVAGEQFAAVTGDRIEYFMDRRGTAPRFTAASPDARAQLVPNLINGYSAAHFEGSGTDFDNYASTGFTLGSGAFSFAAVMRLEEVAQNQAAVGRYASTTSRAVLQITSGNLPRVLAENGFATGGVALASGAWELVIGTFDGSSGLKLWHRGVTSTAVSTSGDTATGALLLGTLQGNDFQSFDGDLAEVLVFNRDILASAGDASLEAILMQATQVYGVAVS